MDSIYVENGFPIASINRVIIISALYLNQSQKTRNRKMRNIGLTQNPKNNTYTHIVENDARKNILQPETK
jgi:hypothetical protein